MMLCKLLPFAVLLGAAASPALAASFDCKAARSPMEVAICSDDELSALDERMSQAYRALLASPEQSSAEVKASQRAWLKEGRRRCEPREDIVSCLKSAYEERLWDYPPGTGTDPASRTWSKSLRIENASAQYDFLLDMGPCEGETCEGSAYLAIQAKGGERPFQAIYMPNVFLTRKADGEPLVNSSRLYDYQGVINVEDFNFDGHADFAVQNGNRGSYGGPSYDVFLFDAPHRRFIHSPPLSALTLENLGFFDVDREHKRLRTFAKSGCCYHQQTEYVMQGNAPVAVKRQIEDAAGGSGEPEMVLLSTEELIDGEWKTTASRNVPFKELYGEQ